MNQALLIREGENGYTELPASLKEILDGHEPRSPIASRRHSLHPERSREILFCFLPGAPATALAATPATI